jgi:hypothetical protein
MLPGSSKLVRKLCTRWSGREKLMENDKFIAVFNSELVS